jgi:hypothetical protein
MLKMLKSEEGSYNIMSFLITLPLVLLMIFIILALQQYLFILNTINDASNTALDIALTQGGLDSFVEDTIADIVDSYGLDPSKLSIDSSSNDPENPAGIYYDDDNFVKRGYVVSLKLSYNTSDSMINKIATMLGFPENTLNQVSTAVSGMSQRWSQIESEVE